MSPEEFWTIVAVVLGVPFLAFTGAIALGIWSVRARRQGWLKDAAALDEELLGDWPQSAPVRVRVKRRR